MCSLPYQNYLFYKNIVHNSHLNIYKIYRVVDPREYSSRKVAKRDKDFAKEFGIAGMQLNIRAFEFLQSSSFHY